MAGPFIFQKLAQAGRAAGVTPQMTAQGYVAAREWYREKASQVRTVNVNRMMEETKSRLFARGTAEDVGTMICFFYKAKNEATLPYYDQFPLVFPMAYEGDSFLSLNLHYLPPVLRAKLMDQLYTVAIMPHGKVEKLALSYNVLAGAAQFSAFRPCIKKHLFSQMRSKMFYVRPEEWDTALLLPTQRFVGATSDQVWRDSRRVIGRR